jgi:hypothetical protein
MKTGNSVHTTNSKIRLIGKVLAHLRSYEPVDFSTYEMNISRGLDVAAPASAQVVVPNSQQIRCLDGSSRVLASHAGGPGSIPGRDMSVFIILIFRLRLHSTGT